MGHYIAPFDKSPHKDQVYIQVLDQDSKELIGVIDEVGGKNVIYLDARKYEENEEGSATYKFLLKLNVETDELKDFQYVMDAKTLPEIYDEDDDVLVHDNELDDDVEMTMKPQFLSYRNGCSGHRGYGVKGDAGLEFQITVPSSIRKSKNETVVGVNLVAGYACGREAVVLTKPIFFTLSHSGDVDDQKVVELPIDGDEL